MSERWIELRAALEQALSGRGRLLLLVGEPGIGKTRTAEELVTYARAAQAQVLWGRCYEGDGAPAYWPWVQAIRSYVQDSDAKHAGLAEMGSGASDLARWSPRCASGCRACRPRQARARAGALSALRRRHDVPAQRGAGRSR